MTARSDSGSVRVALIGAGSMANRIHCPSLAGFGDVEFAGLCDLDQARLQATAKKFNITKTFLDYRELLDDTKPDAVYVLMGPHHLFDITMDVLDRGLAVFIEKPPAVTTHQTIALARKAKSKGVVSAVGFQRRFHPLLVETCKRVREIGPIRQVVLSWYKFTEPREIHPYYRGAVDIWRFDGIHAVDAIRYYAGLPEVVCVASNVRKLDCWYHSAMTAIIQFDNGVEGVFLGNWRSGKRTFKAEFHAEGAIGVASIDGEACIYAKGHAEPDWQSDYKTCAGSDLGHIHQGFAAENRAFIDAVKSGRPPHHCLEDSVKSMELVDDIFRRSMSDEPLTV